MESLSEQLKLERWARQVMGRMHSTLDRDALLHQVADSLGSGLNINRCLVARVESLPSGSDNLALYEYSESNRPPFGFSKTSPILFSLVNHFLQKEEAYSDLLKSDSGLATEDIQTLVESGVQAMAGIPIRRHGNSQGVIIFLEYDGTKDWAKEEMEIASSLAEQAAIALNHCESFHQLQEQLFRSNMIGTLTQQLTNALEVATTNYRASVIGEKTRQVDAIAPLSFRELEVLKLIAAGYPNREIAKSLFLTESTIELHASRIRKKLQLKSRTALVKYACDHALV